MATRHASAEESNREEAMETSRVDAKGRITLPADLRKRLDIQKGETVCFRREGEAIVLKKGINPFDAAVEEALREYREGNTTKLEDFAAEMGITLE